MPIFIDKYVSARTGVAGAAAVRSRELIGRILSTSAVLQPGIVTEFSSLTDVGSVFATTSPEYQFAAKYFGFVSKNNGGARKLSFGRWTKLPAAAQITGGPGVFGAGILASLKLATALTLNVTDGDGVSTSYTVEVDLSGAADFDAARALIQIAIRAETNPQLAQANVLYTAATGVFTFVAGAPAVAGRVDVIAQPNTADDVGYWLNWMPSRGAVVSAQSPAQSPVDAITASAAISDNFGSFGFIDSSVSPRVPLQPAELAAVALWNHAQNVRFVFCALTTVANSQVDFDTNRGASGTSLGLAVNDFAEFTPMIVMASIDYSRPNASTNFMYQQLPTMASAVSDTTLSNRMDAIRVNYIGQTMANGQQLAFYQRGVLLGGPNDPVDTGTYVNEIWLKDRIVTSFLTMLLTLGRIPANAAGEALILTNLEQVVVEAVANGVISVGKLLNTVQKQAITQMTDDPDAWLRVQTAGYVINVWLREEVTTDGRTEYVAVYQLIYAKDDQIRKVEGTNTLI